ncbi:MAG: ATP-binding cassette domain-containing protein [Candidatus Wallbacteria bacterium]|nr:ATP-binding cassette domain-containing protein [Candidatus Wallbacteria bacterium]
MTEMIKVEKLHKYYGDVHAVKDASFSVKRGEIVGLLGPNGAGKTTIMKIITGFMAATSGTVEVGGHDVLTHPLDVKEKIGYLPENSPLYFDMNVSEYLHYIAELRGIKPGKIGKAVEEKVKTCGLVSMLYRNIGALSKGFRQRVGLASVLLHEPEILILDEPTSGLDPRQIIEIRELIKEIGREKTIILSSHILTEVSVTCQRVVIISNGKIVAQGPTADLASSLSGNDIVYVTFRAPAQEVEAKISSFNFIVRKECQVLDDGLVRFKLETKKTPRSTEEIFAFAVNNNYLISELHRDSMSLEDIFIQLTTQEEAK